MNEKDKETLSADPDVKNFVVNYTDGSQRIIEKGFFCEITKGPEVTDLSFILADCNGNDIKTIVKGCIELGFRLGIIPVAHKVSGHQECNTVPFQLKGKSAKERKK